MNYDKVIHELDTFMDKCTKCGKPFKSGDIILTGIKNYHIVCIHVEECDEPLMSSQRLLYLKNGMNTLF